MPVSKYHLAPSTRLVLLGVTCDTVLKRFEVPQSKIDKLEIILHRAIKTGSITFALLEKLAGKCTSMSVVVPPTALYTHHMHKCIGNLRR